MLPGQYSRLVKISRLIHQNERLIRENHSPRPSRVQFRIKFDILSASNLGVFSLKSDTMARLAHRTSGPYAHPQASPLPLAPPSPFTNTRNSFFRIVFFSVTGRYNIIQVADTSTNIMIDGCLCAAHRSVSEDGGTGRETHSRVPFDLYRLEQRDKLGDPSCRGSGDWWLVGDRWAFERMPLNNPMEMNTPPLVIVTLILLALRIIKFSPYYPGLSVTG